MATPNYGYERRQRELAKKKKKEDKGYIIEIQDALEKRYDTKVHLSSRGKKGKIEFVYSSLEELDRLLEQLGYEKTN